MPLSDGQINGVVEDLALHPDTTFAIILRGQLLPVRFAKRAEASGHLLTLMHTDRAVAANKEHAA